MVPVNVLAVIAAAIVAMVLGFIWYGPLFGKPWMRLMGFSMETMKAENSGGAMAKMYALMSVGALLMAFVLAHSVIFASAYMNIGGLDAGALVGFMSWLGFAAPVTLNYSLTGHNKSWKLWLINAGYYLVSLVLMGIVLALWA